MENKRSFQRIEVDLQAHCTGADCETIDCSIIEVSHGGMIISLNVQEEPVPGTTLALDIDVPGRDKPANCLVKIKWCKPARTLKGYNYFVGGKITLMTRADKEGLLDYAYAALLHDESS